MHHIVERVFFEVTLRYFFGERDKGFKVDVCEFKQVVELEYFVDEEGQTCVVQDLIEVESIERCHIDSVQSHFQMLDLHIDQVKHHQKFLVDFRVNKTHISFGLRLSLLLRRSCVLLAVNFIFLRLRHFIRELLFHDQSFTSV